VDGESDGEKWMKRDRWRKINEKVDRESYRERWMKMG
jgi:hypothetical protein